MPSALLRACSGRHGCPALVTGGACDDCRRSKQTAYDDRRGTAASRGYDSRWARYSLWARSTVLLFCGDRMPGARETADSVCRREARVTQLAAGGGVVDHIEPVNGRDDPRFYDKTNHQGLCHECHNAKRQREAMAAKGAA